MRDSSSAPPSCPGVFTARVQQATDEAVVIELVGELDIAAVDRFHTAVGRYLGRPQVCLDLSALTFLDCAGLAALITAHHQVLCRGGQLVLVRIPRTVRQIIELTGAGEVLGTQLSTSPPAPRTAGRPPDGQWE